LEDRSVKSLNFIEAKNQTAKPMDQKLSDLFENDSLLLKINNQTMTCDTSPVKGYNFDQKEKSSKKGKEKEKKKKKQKTKTKQTT